MLLNKSLALGLISVVGLSACSSKDNKVADYSSKFSVASIMNNPNLSAEDKAEELSKGAQLLVTPTTFMYASSVADAALSLNAKNPRARFIKGLLGPAMEMKGIVHRIVPLVNAHPQFQRGFTRLVRDIRKADPAVQSFLFNGPFDIRTEGDVQEFIARVTVRYDEFRRTLGDLKDTEFTITANVDAFSSHSVSEASSRCQVSRPVEGVYDLSQCPSSKYVSRKLNRADFEILKQQVAGAQVYATILNGYDLSGVLTASESKEQDPKKALETLLQTPAFGHLRKTSGFGVMPDIAKDAVLGARWAIETQSELCPNGSQQGAPVRPGYLFESGLCIEQQDRVVQVMAMVESVAQGNTIQLETARHMKINVAPMKFFSAPIEDLRTQLPVRTNQCGRVTGIGSGTLGEVFPTADLNKMLEEESHCQ
jgi:hypothetical protein